MRRLRQIFKMNSREGLLEREKEIIRLLNIFLDSGLDFVVVGGYAIATYKKRFSVDLDLVIQEKDVGKFEKICEKEKYALGYDKDVPLLYEEKFKRFVKKIKGLEVAVDFLINGLVSRSTDTTWSFDYIKKYSEKRRLEGMEFLIPKKELLMAMKFHSRRLTDIRDVVALMPCDVGKLKKHLLKGDLKKLKEGIKRQERFLQKPQFDDSFKGIFGIHMYKEEDVERTKDVIGKLKF